MWRSPNVRAEFSHGLGWPVGQPYHGSEDLMRGLGRRCDWKTLSEYELDQILAESVHKLGADRIMECVEPRNYSSR